MNDEDELTEAERRALEGLPEGSPLPLGFEDRVVDSLRGRGLVVSTGPAIPGRRVLLRLASAAGLFGTGLWAGLLAGRGARGGPAAVPPAPLYLLLLYGGPGFVDGTPEDEGVRVAEYGAWAAKLRRAGQLVSAQKLRDGARVLEGNEPAASGAGPQGFFLVRARDLEEAEAIARACPHLRHGGRVAVQAVDPT